METQRNDVAIIGGGIVGLATAMALAQHGGHSVVVLEAEDRLAAHQTGHNSGVIHSGLYYRPGSLKARNCAEGRDALYRFCEVHEIPHERCGKVVVATSKEEIPRLDELERRGHANGLKGLRRLTKEELREHEPHVAGIDGLFVPETGIVDFSRVAEAMASIVQESGGVIRLMSRVLRCERRADEIILETTSGPVRCRYLVNCAGLHCDRVARLCGVQPEVRIVPFRGEYYELVPERRHLVHHLIYPVPDPRFPFLGVHFTRMIDGSVEAGPNAVLALAREGYRWNQVVPGDVFDYLGFLGFWRLASRYWRTGCVEAYRSLHKKAFVKALQRLIPDVQPSDVRRAGAGVRAQALRSDGRLVDDFHLLEADRMTHVLNAPSPAATASISIGRRVAASAVQRLDA